jgi:integrase
MPFSRSTAGASRVRCEISRRSNCANVASTFAIASPAGVVVSTAQSSATSAHPCRPRTRPRSRLRVPHRPSALPKECRGAVEDAAAAAGLERATPHDLRRSFCSLAGRRGVDPIEAAQITGHSPAVWARFYARSFGKAQREEARRRMLEHGFGEVR